MQRFLTMGAVKKYKKENKFFQTIIFIIFWNLLPNALLSDVLPNFLFTASKTKHGCYL